MRKETGVRAQVLDFCLSRTLSKPFPIPDTIEIEERQGTYTSERIVDEDGSRRTLKGGHGF
jgi:hypothetical protein